jgi:hypothetical protein
MDRRAGAEGPGVRTMERGGALKPQQSPPLGFTL